VRDEICCSLEIQISRFQVWARPGGEAGAEAVWEWVDQEDRRLRVRWLDPVEMGRILVDL
jgi:hypothetical protein